MNLITLLKFLRYKLKYKKSLGEKKAHYKKKYLKLLKKVIRHDIDSSKPKISFKDITVVVQGAIDENIQACINSIRTHMPNSEIILSTYEGSIVDGLDCDKVVFNKDPGASGYRDINKNPDNTNRQICTSINGLKQVKTKYAVKMRTDFILEGTNFINYYTNEYLQCKNRHGINLFNKKVFVFGTGYDRFEILDYFQFGLTEDLINLWDIPFSTEEEDYWMLNHTPINVDIYNQTAKCSKKYLPESYILINFLKKKIPNICEIMRDYTERSDKITNLQIEITLNNFICAAPGDNIGVKTLKPSIQKINPAKTFAGLFDRYMSQYDID